MPFPFSLVGRTGSVETSSDKRPLRLNRVIRSGFEAIGADEEDCAGGGGVGYNLWNAESGGAFCQNR